MTEEEKNERAAVARYLRTVAVSRPPNFIRARHPEWTDDALDLGEVLLLTAASQIEAGEHRKLD